MKKRLLNFIGITCLMSLLLSTAVFAKEVVSVEKDSLELEESEEVEDMNSYIGEDVSDFNTNDYIIKYKVTDDKEMFDKVMEAYVDNDGNKVLIVGSSKNETKTVKDDTPELLSSYSMNSEVFENRSDSIEDIDWDAVPANYVYNWDKPDAWVNGVHYTNTNSTDVRHKLQIFSDGENVFVRIEFARDFSTGSICNGSDNNFIIDGQEAKFAVRRGDELLINAVSKINVTEPELISVDIRHGSGSVSGQYAEGSEATYLVNPGHLNDVLTMKIPVKTMKTQNSNINTENIQKVGYRDPNISGGSPVEAAGTSTGSGSLLMLGLTGLVAFAGLLKKTVLV